MALIKNSGKYRTKVAVKKKKPPDGGIFLVDITQNNWNQLVEYIEYWSSRLPNLENKDNLSGEVSPVGS